MQVCAPNIDVCVLYAIHLEVYFSFCSNDAAGMQWILFYLKFITD